MKQNRHVLLIGSLTALLALVIAGCCYRTPEQKAEHAIKRMVSALNLDASQTAKLEKMKEEFLAQRPDRQKMREESFRDIREMMLSPQIDQARLNARTEKIRQHTDDMIAFISMKFVALHDMLSPDQRSKLVEEMEKHMKKAGHW